ncbi:dihydroxyacetone kinase subunit DhaL [Paracoccus sp. WLY502]|uniref:dihydroxyacetone kinase subunit DhaL n=1 Tax=Paracoccus yibinensis TaxID=3068891 RepID=UPI00279657BC|nr:dihydroxyacetone kinase subunit DhaL [Paracoccus sp. WLY502]MDQ1901851.1 dihydroxyacetone kinase subunit DhaL [Paracoccus sp. WLY502]
MLMFTRTDLSDLFRSLAARMAAEQDRLAELDGEIGDADHGVAMAEGFAAASRALIEGEADGQTLADGLSLAATTLLNAVGATTGPLYASALLRAAQAFGPHQAVPFARLADLIPAMAGGIIDRGRGKPGDKTMVDAWLPAVHAVQDGQRRGGDTAAILRAAALAAAEGAEATRAMMAARGRAARLGPRSIGHLDPGAASAAALLDSLAGWAETTVGRRG